MALRCDSPGPIRQLAAEALLEQNPEWSLHLEQPGAHRTLLVLRGALPYLANLCGGQRAVVGLVPEQRINSHFVRREVVWLDRLYRRSPLVATHFNLPIS
jgi:hypothetical protein